MFFGGSEEDEQGSDGNVFWPDPRRDVASVFVVSIHNANPSSGVSDFVFFPAFHGFAGLRHSFSPAAASARSHGFNRWN
jgi:hypothetical protein